MLVVVYSRTIAFSSGPKLHQPIHFVGAKKKKLAYLSNCTEWPGDTRLPVRCIYSSVGHARLFRVNKRPVCPWQRLEGFIIDNFPLAWAPRFVYQNANAYLADCAVCSSGYGRGVANECHRCTETFKGGMYFVAAVALLLTVVVGALLAVFLVRS